MKRADLEARAAFYRSLINSGILMPSEAELLPPPVDVAPEPHVRPGDVIRELHAEMDRRQGKKPPEDT